MEWSKLKAIANRLKSGELDRAFYINFIGDDLAYIFNVKTICTSLKSGLLKLTTRHTNIATADDRGKADKVVILIPKSLGIKLIR